MTEEEIAECAEYTAFYREKGMQYISSFACYFGKDYTDLYGEPDLSAFQ